MGGGDRRDPPGRSDEYRDPDPDDVGGSDAQRRLDALETTSDQQSDLTALPGIGPEKAQMLREAGYETVDDIQEATRTDLRKVDGIGRTLANRLKVVVAAEISDEGENDGPSISGDVVAINERFGVDFSAVEEATAEGVTYPRLAADQREQLREYLRDRHGTTAVENIFETITEWKDEGSYPAEHTQTLEWTAKKALDIGAEIRTGADGTIYAAEPAEDAVAVYEDLHTASRAFLAENFGERFAVHRGVRKRSVGLLAAQALDDPERDRYYFPTSVVSNHSPVSELAETYSDGITVAWDATPSDVALAVDLLRFHDSDREEAELHMKGGILAVNASDILHTGENAGHNRPIHETVARLSDPGSLSASEHEDMSILIERIYEADIRLKTDEGAERVTRWYEEATRHGVFSEKRAEFIATAVAYITLVDPGGGYGDEDI